MGAAAEHFVPLMAVTVLPSPNIDQASQLPNHPKKKLGETNGQKRSRLVAVWRSKGDELEERLIIKASN